MKLHDPRRIHVNSTPQLIGRHVAIPRLMLSPQNDETTRISVMIPDNSNSHKFAARQVYRDVADTRLVEIIQAYRNDPENTLETLFDVSLAPISEPNDADLVRDLRRERAETARKPDLAEQIASIEL